MGAQSGDLTAAVRLGTDARSELAIVNVSRAITYAANDNQWQQAAREAAEAIVETMRSCRTAAQPR